MLSSAKVNHSASAKCDECSGSSHHQLVVARPCEASSEASYIGCRLSEELHTSTCLFMHHTHTGQARQYLSDCVSTVSALSGRYRLSLRSTGSARITFCQEQALYFENEVSPTLAQPPGTLFLPTCTTLLTQVHSDSRVHFSIVLTQGCIWRGLNPPAKISDPLLLLKNARGVVYLCTYALARSSTSIAKTSTPLIKFDKYSPVLTTAPGRVV